MTTKPNRDSNGRFVKKARPFQVGDRVRGRMGKDGDVKSGEIIPTEGCVKGLAGAVSVLADGDAGVAFRTYWAYTKNLTLLNPAPQPKAEEVALVSAMSQMTSPTVSEVIAAKDQEIISLKAEVERLICERDDARSEMTENYKNYRAADDKLDDIRAIMKVDELSMREGRDFAAFGCYRTGLIMAVLDR